MEHVDKEHDAMNRDSATHYEHHENIGLAEFDNGEIAPEAIGGSARDLPPGYYRKPKFIGTMLAVSLGYISTTIAYLIPANLLTIINEDIGPSPNYTWFAIVVSLLSSFYIYTVKYLGNDHSSIWPPQLGSFLLEESPT